MSKRRYFDTCSRRIVLVMRKNRFDMYIVVN